MIFDLDEKIKIRNLIFNIQISEKLGGIREE